MVNGLKIQNTKKPSDNFLDFGASLRYNVLSKTLISSMHHQLAMRPVCIDALLVSKSFNKSEGKKEVDTLCFSGQ